MNFETIAQELFDLCRDRSKSSSNIASDLLSKLKVVPKDIDIKTLEEAIRLYKNSGVGLEVTAKKISNIVDQGIGNIKLGFTLDLNDPNNIVICSTNRDNLIDHYSKYYANKLDVTLVVDTAIKLVELFNFNASDINFFTTEMKLNKDGFLGLYIPEQNKIYSIYNRQIYRIANRIITVAHAHECRTSNCGMYLLTVHII